MNIERSIAMLAGAGLMCVLAGAQANQPTRADAEKDPVFKAMLAELDRSKNDLQLHGFEKPFFIQYRVEDVATFDTRAEYGAGEGGQHSHQRVARVTVRVGDYKTDSSGQRGDGAVQLTALDDDPIAIRSALWNATDQAYKNALSAYAQKQADLKQVQTPPQADDFSKQKPVIVLETPRELKIDEYAWNERVAHESGLYRTDPTVKATEKDVQYSTSSFHARASTSWLKSIPKAPSCANRARATRRSLPWARRPTTACGWIARMPARALLSRTWIPRNNLRNMQFQRSASLSGSA